MSILQDASLYQIVASLGVIILIIVAIFFYKLNKLTHHGNSKNKYPDDTNSDCDCH